MEELLRKQRLKTMPMNSRIAYYLVNCLKAEKKFGYFTTKHLLNKLDKSAKSVYNCLGDLNNLGFIKNISSRKPFIKRKLTQRGHDFLENNNLNRNSLELLNL